MTSCGYRAKLWDVDVLYSLELGHNSVWIDWPCRSIARHKYTSSSCCLASALCWLDSKHLNQAQTSISYGSNVSYLVLNKFRVPCTLTICIKNIYGFVLYIAGGRLEMEMRYTAKVLGEKESISHLLVTQKANEGTSPEVSRHRLLHKKSLLNHLITVKAATRTTVTLFDV